MANVTKRRRSPKTTRFSVPSCLSDPASVASAVRFAELELGLIVLMGENTFGSMSSDDKNEVVCSSSRVLVFVINLSTSAFASFRGVPLRSRIFWKFAKDESPTITR